MTQAETAFAGGKEVLAVDCTDPLAAVMGAGAGIHIALTKHAYSSHVSSH